MSNKIVSRTASLAKETALSTVWRQWDALTTGVVGADARGSWTIIDPEALVIASLALSSHERRLDDLVANWASAAGFLMSKPRLKSVAKLFPDSELRVGEFASYAADNAQGRWRELASRAHGLGSLPRDKPIGPLNLLDGPALVLRFRAGFGINAKADVMALLLGRDGKPTNLKLIAAGTAYTERMIRTASEEMVLAGFIQEIEGRPSAFYVDPEPWARLMGFAGAARPAHGRPIPPWQFWGAILSFLVSVIAWGERADRDAWTDYVASSKARDLIHEHDHRLKQAGLLSPNPNVGRGAAYLGTFLHIVRQVCEGTLNPS